MLTDLKVVSLACMGVFCTPEHDTKGGPQGTQFWRSWNAKMTYPTDKAWRVDWRKWEKYILIMRKKMLMKNDDEEDSAIKFMQEQKA